MTQIADIQLRLDGVRFIATASLVPSGREEASAATAHGALHALAGQLEKRAKGEPTDDELLQCIRNELQGLPRSRWSAEVVSKIAKIVNIHGPS